MTNNHHNIVYVDDDTESTRTLVWLRIPSLFIGLIFGVTISFVTSRFEQVLSQNIQVAFFLPFIVYMADAIGTQTNSIYARDLRSGRAVFHHYLVKESALGIIFGAVFGLAAGFLVAVWLAQTLLAFSVGISMFAATASAPLVALFITQIFDHLGRDPAAGAGPIATVIQDMISVVIYGAVCTAILL
jgi:magnesium transporter